MKKFLLIITLIFTFFIVNIDVNAEESSNIQYGCDTITKTCNYYYAESYPYGITTYAQWNEFNKLYKNYSSIIDNMYDSLIKEYQINYSEDYPYYHVALYLDLNPNMGYNYDDLDKYFNGNDSNVIMYLYLYDSVPSLEFSKLEDVKDYTNNSITKVYFKLSTNLNTPFLYTSYYDKEYKIVTFHSDADTVLSPGFTNNTAHGLVYNTYNIYLPLYYFDSNFDFINNTGYTLTIPAYNNLIIEPGDVFEPIKSSYERKNYTEVNLDDYEYVILNLKDYSKKEAFETNLQVKGSIGITPVYEFGTTEKENITDLCNISYSDFTDYRFFVLKNDLINNAIYIVKECSDSGSSFRFDSNVFDITYVTAENVDDPVVTFGGVEYHTIPFNKLSNTVNKNEEENFIPGSTEQFDPFGDVVDYVSSFWNSLTTFMGLVTKFFNTLPVEIRAISITMFTTAITLGVIKFIKS